MRRTTLDVGLRTTASTLVQVSYQASAAAAVETDADSLMIEIGTNQKPM